MRRPVRANRKTGTSTSAIIAGNEALSALPGSLEGQGGDKGGGGFSEDPDTLQSRAMARVLDLISEGEIAGLVDGDKSIYLDQTPIRNPDNSANFQGIGWWEVPGTDDQPYIPGFPSAETEVAVATALTVAGGRVVRRINQLTTDAVRVTAGLPNGLSETDTEDSRLKGSTVTIRVEVKPQADAGGTWVTVRDWVITGKATSPYEEEFRFDLPGVGPWDVGLTRLTPDATSSTLVNGTNWVRYTRIIDHKFAYPNSALVGLEINAEYFGQSIPPREYLVDGIICRVPTNYNPVTRVYATTGLGTTGGAWDGTFKRAFTDNPVWVFFDQLTDPRYGLGAADSKVDKYALYGIAQYCDELVPDGFGGTEPRLTFNGKIDERSPASQVLQSIASTFRGMFYWSAGSYTAVQDGPRDPIAQFSQANVNGGDFNYTSTPKKARHTVAIVEWINPDLGYKRDYLVVEDADAIARYGYNALEVRAFGCTTRGQAWRFGKWALITEKFERQSVTFRTGLEGKHLLPGDIITIADPYYAGARMAGRLISVAGTRDAVTLDAPFAFAPAETYLVNIVLKDGTIFESQLVNPGTTATTVSLVTLLPSANLPVAGATYTLVSNDLEPMRFRVVNRKEVGKGTFEIFAVERFEGKFNLVDVNPGFDAVTTPVTRLPVPSFTNPPTDVVATYETRGGANSLTPRIRVSWQKSPDTHVAGYIVSYRAGAGNWENLPMSGATEAIIEPVVIEDYEIRVVAINAFSIPSQAVTTTILASTIQSATGKSLISNVRVQGGGTTFSGPNAVIAWDSSAISSPTALGVTSGLDPFFEAFRVRVYNAAETITYRTEEVTSPRWDYTADKITADLVGRSFKIGVSLKAKDGTFSNEVKTSFSNPAPLAPVFSLVAGAGTVEIRVTQPTDPDFVGYQIHASTTNGFTPGPGNLVGDGSGSITLTGTPGTTVYVRVAAYDTFGKAGLVYATQQSAVYGAITASSVGAGAISAASFASGIVPVEVLGALPATGNFAGRMVFLTSDSKLYRHTGTPTNASGFIAAVAAADVTGTIIASQIATATITADKFASSIAPVEILGALPATGNFAGRTVFLTTDSKLYRHTGTPTNASGFVTAVAAADVTGTLTNSQIADLAATKITGTLVASQIANATLTADKFATSARPVEVLGTLPGTGNFAGRMVFQTSDNKLYRHNGTNFVASVPSTDITGTLTNSQIADLAASKITGTLISSQIADAAITAAKFASGLTPVEVLAALPATGNFQGRMVFLTSDSKLYRHLGTPTNASGFTPAVAAADVSGQIARAQIATGAINAALIEAGAVGSSQLAAGAVIAGKITAGTIVAADIAANTITAAKIAAGTITATEIAATTITAAKIAANTITAGQIAAGTITATEIAANTITAGKLFIGAQGSALNDDPGCADASAWVSYSGPLPTFATITDGKVGNTVMRSTGAGVQSWVLSAKRVPIDSNKTYRIRMWARTTSGSGSTFYGVFCLKDSAGADIANEGTHYWYAPSAVTPSGTFTEYVRVVGAGTASTIPSNARTMQAGAILSYGGGTSIHEVQDIRIEEVLPGTLIQDGSIITNKIAALAITAAKIAVGTITANEIAANTITAAKIAAGTITATEIAATTITAAKIAANTITAAQIAAGTITATQIAAGTITADKLVANSITAGQIAAGTITATQIAANTITASKLILSNNDSVFPDTSILDPVYHSGGALSAFTSIFGAATHADGVANQPRRSFAVSGTLHYYSTAPITVENGATYRVRLKFYRPAGVTGHYCSFMHLPGTALVQPGTNTSNPLEAGWPGINVGSYAADTWHTFTTTVTHSNAYNYIQMFHSHNLSGGTMFAQWDITRAASADMIVDGAITAVKIAATTITGDKIAANTISADKIVANSITSGQIAAGSISADRLSVSSLSAISGTIGLLRTATTGARMELESNQGRVYDASGVLRVRWGVW